MLDFFFSGTGGGTATRAAVQRYFNCYPEKRSVSCTIDFLPEGRKASCSKKDLIGNSSLVDSCRRFLCLVFSGISRNISKTEEVEKLKDKIRFLEAQLEFECRSHAEELQEKYVI